MNYKKNGDPFVNYLSITPIHDEQGQLTHYVGIQSDITELVNHKKAELAAKHAALQVGSLQWIFCSQYRALESSDCLAFCSHLVNRKGCYCLLRVAAAISGMQRMGLHLTAVHILSFPAQAQPLVVGLLLAQDNLL